MLKIMFIMGKISSLVISLVVLAICCIGYAFFGDKDYSTYALIAAGGLFVIAFIGYSCDNAARVPDDYDDGR